MTAYLPPGFICSAYFYAAAAGMVDIPLDAGDLEFLRELGLRAALLARWEGIPAVRVPEGPFVNPGVYLWPERIWSEVAGVMADHAAEHGDYGAPEGVLPPGARSPGQVPPSAGFSRDPSCYRCNYDMHYCKGCGEPLPHGTEICAGCSRDEPVPVLSENETGHGYWEAGDYG